MLLDLTLAGRPPMRILVNSENVALYQALPNEAPGCHVIFVGALDKPLLVQENLDDILSRGKPE